MNKSHEIITVTYYGDLANLYYHVLSLRRFWKGQKNFTLVVEDSQDTLDWCERVIRPLLSDWTVKILLSPEMDPMDGWHRQQILKLWASSISNNDYSIILDCKNFLIRDYTFDENFIDGKLLVPLYGNSLSSDPNHLDNFQRQKTICDFFGLDAEETSIMFCITPFFFDNHIVKEMLDFIKNKGVNFYGDTFMRDKYEAFLYWIFAQRKVPHVESFRPLARGQYGGCSKDETLSVEQFQQQLDEVKSYDESRFFVFHRFHATPTHLKMLSDYLKELDIITDEDCNFYITTFKNSVKFIRPTVQEFLIPYWENSW